MEGREQIWVFQEPGYVGLFYGVPQDTRNSEELGLIHYRFPCPDLVELEYIKTHRRRQGYAKMLYEAFLKTIQEKYPQVRFVMAKATSQRAYNIHNKSLGEPDARFIQGRRATHDAVFRHLPLNTV